MSSTQHDVNEIIAHGWDWDVNRFKHYWDIRIVAEFLIQHPVSQNYIIFDEFPNATEPVHESNMKIRFADTYRSHGLEAWFKYQDNSTQYPFTRVNADECFRYLINDKLWKYLVECYHIDGIEPTTEEVKPKKKRKKSVRIGGKAMSKKKLIEMFGG